MWLNLHLRNLGVRTRRQWFDKDAGWVKELLPSRRTLDVVKIPYTLKVRACMMIPYVSIAAECVYLVRRGAACPLYSPDCSPQRPSHPSIVTAFPTCLNAHPSPRSTTRLMRRAPQVYTGDLKNAGTDAGIHINLIGERGETGYVPLLANYDTFERGQVAEGGGDGWALGWGGGGAANGPRCGAYGAAISPLPPAFKLLLLSIVVRRWTRSSCCCWT